MTPQGSFSWTTFHSSKAGLTYGFSWSVREKKIPEQAQLVVGISSICFDVFVTYRCHRATTRSSVLPATRRKVGR
jgi:hypothetical protein